MLSVGSKNITSTVRPYIKTARYKVLFLLVCTSNGVYEAAGSNSLDAKQYVSSSRSNEGRISNIADNSRSGVVWSVAPFSWPFPPRGHPRCEKNRGYLLLVSFVNINIHMTVRCTHGGLSE